MTATPDRDAVLAALARVIDPVRGVDLVAGGMVAGLAVTGDTVSFAIAVDPARAPALEPLRAEAEAAVRAVPGVARVLAVLTAHNPAPTPAQAPPPGAGRIDGVDRIVAVASGKGGVGKSTVSVNLALALAQEGARVGLLDADVYGPSQPRMLGLTGRPASPDGRTIEPMSGHGLAVMSMGFMTGEDQSIVWRGPMLMSALMQMLHQVNWGRLDYLIVDLPPGTGDVQLTLTQKVQLAGAVVVSTPQDIALLDARKALDMFRKTGTPVLGLIENMSGFCCPNCGHETPIFGHGGARAEAARLGLPFLGEIPLELETRLMSDNGTPVVVAQPLGPQAGRFRAIARAVMTATAGA